MFFLESEYVAGDDIILIGKKDGEYSIYALSNDIGYKPYNGEYITAYGKIFAVSKQPMFFEIKGIRIETQIIEQAEPSEELKNDILIQEFINLE